MSRKWILAGIAGAVLILAFFTNPDQAAHLRAIKETVALRPESAMSGPLLLVVEYHNYLVFSTTSYKNMTFTHGYFGKIQTTNDIGFFYGGNPPE